MAVLGIILLVGGAVAVIWAGWQPAVRRNGTDKTPIRNLPRKEAKP